MTPKEYLLETARRLESGDCDKYACVYSAAPGFAVVDDPAWHTFADVNRIPRLRAMPLYDVWAWYDKPLKRFEEKGGSELATANRKRQLECVPLLRKAAETLP